MKNTLKITCFFLITVFYYPVHAQESNKKLTDFERYKLQQNEQLQEFKEKREADIKRLEQEYKNYLNGLSNLQKEYEENDEPEKAEHVADMIDYEKTVRKHAGKELKKEDFEKEAVEEETQDQAEKPEEPEETVKKKTDDSKESPETKISIEKNQEANPETTGETDSPLKKDLEFNPSSPTLIPLPQTAARITSPFGTRMHPVLNKKMKHNGVDFGSPMNTDIYAAANGKVTVAQYSKSFGNFIMVEHEDGYVTVYAHLESMDVKPGDTVKKGDKIALSGNTGRSTGPHLHYEIRLDGTPVDPDNYLTQQL